MTASRKPTPNYWAANILASSATELRDALEAYPSLATRVGAQDESARAEALDHAQRIAAVRRAMVLRIEDINAGTTEEISPVRARVALCRLESALVGLVQVPRDERAQLNDEELAELRTHGGLEDWMTTVIKAADDELAQQ
jgi:hypothetical protein